MSPNPRRTIADFPALVATFHPSKNGSLRPEQVSRGSDKKIWWTNCPHCRMRGQRPAMTRRTRERILFPSDLNSSSRRSK